MRKRRKKRKWIYADPSVRMPVFFLRSEAWRELSYAAMGLYVFMRASMFDPENGFRNTNEYKVSFGPVDAEKYGMRKKTYYRALGELLESGVIERVSEGLGGRKAVFNLLTLNWIGGGRKKKEDEECRSRLTDYILR